MIYVPPPAHEFIFAHIQKNTAKINWNLTTCPSSGVKLPGWPQITALFIDDVWVERKALDKSLGERFMDDCDYWIPRCAVHDDYTPGRGWDYKKTKYGYKYLKKGRRSLPLRPLASPISNELTDIGN